MKACAKLFQIFQKLVPNANHILSCDEYQQSHPIEMTISMKAFYQNIKQTKHQLNTIKRTRSGLIVDPDSSLERCDPGISRRLAVRI